MREVHGDDFPVAAGAHAEREDRMIVPNRDETVVEIFRCGVCNEVYLRGDGNVSCCVMQCVSGGDPENETPVYVCRAALARRLQRQSSACAACAAAAHDSAVAGVRPGGH